MANAIKKYGKCYQFLWQNFVENSKFRDLWQKYGKCHTIYMANAISFLWQMLSKCHVIL